MIPPLPPRVCASSSRRVYPIRLTLFGHEGGTRCYRHVLRQFYGGSRVCVPILGIAIAAPAAKGSKVDVLTFTIDNAPAGYALSGDGIPSADSSGTYMDYRLASGGAADPNYCVEASPSASGLTFIRLNRKLDGDAGYQYCGLYRGT